MKHLIALAIFTLSVITSNAQGVVVPPTEGVREQYYSMGAFLKPMGEDENWDAGFLVRALYSTTSDDVWFNNLFPQYFIDKYDESKESRFKSGDEFPYNAWVHGTVRNGRIVFAKEVVLNHADDQTGEEIPLSIVGIKEGDDHVEAMDSFSLVVAENGTLYMEDFLNGDIIQDDEYYMPMFYSCLAQLDGEGQPVFSEEGVAQVKDYAGGYKLVPVDKSLTTYPDIPARVRMENWWYNMTEAYGGQEGRKLVSLGFDGKDVYVKGLCTMALYDGSEAYPDVVLKGTLSDDGMSFTLPTRQFYGFDNYYGIIYLTLFWGMEWNYDEEWYDPIDGVKWEKKSDTKWEMAEDTNIVGCSLDGNPLEIIALATLTTDDSGIETIHQHPTPNTQHPTYNLAGQRVGNSARGITVCNGRKTVR